MAVRRTAHRMTPARRAALRKAQVASARKRSRAARTSAHIKRHKRKYAVGTVAVVAGGYVAQDNVRNVRLYHNTDSRYVSSIKQNGLRGVQKGSFSHVNFAETPGAVFVTKGRNTAKMFGDTVVKVKMNRREFNKHAERDLNMSLITNRAYSIQESYLKGKKLKVRKGGRRQKAAYKSLFPDGTKESYRTRAPI